MRDDARLVRVPEAQLGGEVGEALVGQQDQALVAGAVQQVGVQPHGQALAQEPVQIQPIISEFAIRHKNAV